MKVLMIRHGFTKSNLEKRYLGKKDESLCNDGVLALNSLSYPKIGMLYVSPLARCRQTAELLFPWREKIICKELQECDFGDFEGKNFEELNGDPAYQGWIESGGRSCFPNGENPKHFRERCVYAFENLLMAHQEFTIVAHGGTLMAIMEHVAGSCFYNWGVENGRGYLLTDEGWERV